ncbi:MAG: energy transducer TonB [Candidatus Margulisiibacteriota bacterium]
MQENKLSLVNVLLALTVALVGSLILVKPIAQVKQANVPVFMGEMATGGQVRAIRVAKVETATKAEVSPAPLPKAISPLPILPPKIICQFLPAYPMTAIEQSKIGTTLLAVYIGSSGSADKVEVKTSSGVSAIDAAAVNAVAQWKFSAATQGGAGIASCLEVPIRFALKD